MNSRGMPAIGDAIQIRVGSRAIHGTVTAIAVRTGTDNPQHGLKKGDVVPGLGIMTSPGGSEYWFKNGEWEPSC